MIQVYTGNGKGKTTAAIGLAIRAAGAGKKVFIGQFIKGKSYSELKTLKRIKNIKVEQFGRGCFIRRRPDIKDIEAAQKGLEKLKKVISEKFDVVILDEINIALKLGLLETSEVLKFIRKTPKKIELILTGRSAPSEILKAADLISEIKEIKHYYKKGLKARRGIEY
jgi:cob(I)alamin adenosyltransferase